MKKIKEIRNAFRESVLKRDNYQCRVCGIKGVKLDAHHINNRHYMPNGGYVLENGISLCDRDNGCHWKAEQFHLTDGEDWEDGFHPNDLYDLIGSSYEEAFDKSELLNI